MYPRSRGSLILSQQGEFMDDQLMLDPVKRRRWLLLKALEIAPLREAFALAQAADDFISGTAAQIADRTASEVMQAPIFRAGLETEKTQQRPSTAFGTNAGAMVGTEALAGLSSLVTFDDLIRYLRQGGEVFEEHEGAVELLARANLKRTGQGLPPFTLLPGTPAKAAVREKPNRAEKVAHSRPPTARERAEWARRVVALAVE